LFLILHGLKKRFSFFTVLFLLHGFLFAQPKAASDTLPPLRIVEKYLSPGGFPEKLKYFCCELYQEWYADSTLGQQLPKRVKRECRLVYSDTLHATVAAWLHDSITSRDIYFYLVKKQNWTIYAMRALVMTGFAKDELKRMDSIPPGERGRSYEAKNGHSFVFDHNNLQLWSGPDAALEAYFNKNRAQFVSLQKQLLKKGFYGKQDSLLVNALNDKKIRKAADKLLIRSIGYEKKYPGAVFFVLGGMSDNTVGYLYQPDPAKVPRMTEKKFILVLPLCDGWYLFKTT
jgi:hypothetical protein